MKLDVGTETKGREPCVLVAALVDKALGGDGSDWSLFAGGNEVVELSLFLNNKIYLCIYRNGTWVWPQYSR